MKEKKVSVLFGVPVDNVNMAQATQKAAAFLDQPGNHLVVTPNAEIMHMCIKEPQVRQAVCAADLIVPDGIGVVLAAKIMKKPLQEKVAGIDLAANLLGELEKKGKKLFLLGAKPGVAKAAAAKMTEIHPRLQIAGMHDGYFEEDGPVIAQINQSGADALFVCLGAPKQEMWMNRYRDQIQTHLMMGLGGVLDVYAGNVKRAPDLFVKLGLEWFYRLLKQPSRLGRMMKLPAFLIRAMAARLSRSAS